MPIIALILANLPTIISAGKAGYDFIHSVRAAAMQSGEWTPDNETAFAAGLAAQEIDPAWKCDAQPGAVSQQILELVTAIHAAVTATTAAPVLTLVAANADSTAGGSKTDAVAPVLNADAGAASAEVASAAAPVICPTCGGELIPDHPGNCNC